MAFNINNQKVKAPPIASIKMGKNCVTKTIDSQSVRTVTDIAMPLILLGKISEIITQGIGPNEAPKQAIYPRININNQGPCVQLK